MKKILFLFLFLITVLTSAYSDNCYTNGISYTTSYVAKPLYTFKKDGYWRYAFICTNCVGYTCGTTPPPLMDSDYTDGVCTRSDAGVVTCTKNPDPLGGKQCRDLFQKDGVAYTCNPNTNEATEIPYSDGTTYDPDNNEDIPNCNDGYSVTNKIYMSANGSDTPYKSWSCSKNVTNPDGSITGDNGVIIGADGSITTPNPAGGSTTVFVNGSTSTIHPDGSITTTPPTTPPPTDPGTGTSGGSTGGTDSGSGSTTGGTSGTGSTGGTTGTDTGSGSTGGTDTGTTDTGGTSGTGTGDFGTDSSNTDYWNQSNTGTGTSGGGSTGGTDSGTTTGTDTGTGTTGTDSGTGGTGSTGTGTTGTDSGTATGAGDCNDSNMTLIEKTLCKISNIFTPAGTNPTSNPLASSNSLIDGVTSEYSTFKTNIANQGDTLKSLVYTSIDTVNQGFTFNISPNEVVSCPKDYTLDLSALNMANMNVVLDICLQTSKLQPYFYPLFLIMFSVGTTLITFRMLGVLI